MKIPSWFNSKEYLKKNPDVANDVYWGSRPFDHFMSSGYPEHRTWNGDPRPPFTSGSTPPEEPLKGTLKVGETHKVTVDGFTGEENDTEPIASQDNPEWERYNIKKGAKREYAYWYSSKTYGKGYIDVKPDFGKLGTGKFHITTVYRKTRNRAKYPAIYEIIRNGKVVFTKKVYQYQERSEFATVDLGEHSMNKGDYLKMSDKNGSSSICFAHVNFKLVSSDVVQ